MHTQGGEQVTVTFETADGTPIAFERSGARRELEGGDQGTPPAHPEPLLPALLDFLS